MIQPNCIVVGNSVDVLKDLADDSIDLVVTSPPYNIGKDYDNYSDNLTDDEYKDMMYSIFKQLYRIMIPGSRLCINLPPGIKGQDDTHFVIIELVRKVGFKWYTDIVWNKNNYSARFTVWGSWVKPTKPYFKHPFEYIFVFSKPGRYKTKGEKDIHPDEFKKWTTALWTIKPEGRMKQYEHPAMFPEDIPYRLIKLFTYKGDTVLDMFNGAGTTTYVAAKLNRKFIGIDISPEYCNTAFNRLGIYRKTCGVKLIEYGRVVDG